MKRYGTCPECGKNSTNKYDPYGPPSSLNCTDQECGFTWHEIPGEKKK